MIHLIINYNETDSFIVLNLKKMTIEHKRVFDFGSTPKSGESQMH